MVSSNHIKPGEKGKIKAKIDIKERRGLINKNVQIISNDPERKVIILSLKAFID
jgi:LEA14-like dessication related protein